MSPDSSDSSKLHFHKKRKKKIHHTTTSEYNTPYAQIIIRNFEDTCGSLKKKLFQRNILEFNFFFIRNSFLQYKIEKKENTDDEEDEDEDDEDFPGGKKDQPMSDDPAERK